VKPRLSAFGWRLLSHAQAGLPVLAAAGLAGFTWWLVQSSPREASVSRAAPISTAPDYVLSHAQVVRFDAQGRAQAVIDGQSMQHFADQDRLQIDQLVLSARGPQGQGLHATAMQGQANGQAEVVLLEGDAHVLATPPAQAVESGHLRGGPARFAGETLVVDTRQHTVSSELPVLLTQGTNVIHAQSMHHNELTGITELKGRVRGRYDLSSQP
jgi:lipopolysaccharide export system protein LptC